MGSLLPAILLVSIACLAVLVDCVPGSKPEPPPFEDGEADGVPLQRDGKNPTARGDYHGYGGYGGYGGGYGGRGGKGKPSECRDKKLGKYCQKVKANKKCIKAKKRNKCRKTCGDCVVEECKDTSWNCYQKNALLCTQFWFSYGCQKTCGKCTDEVSTTTTRQTTKTTTTMRTTTTTTEEASKECKDIAPNCDQATKFRCAIDWFVRGCRLTCGTCTTEVMTTTAPMTTPLPPTPTTPQPTPEEMTTLEPTTNCEDEADDCDSFFTWFCEIPILYSQCRKFCGGCEIEETTTQASTESPTTKKKCTKTASTTMTTSTERKPLTERTTTAAVDEETTETKPTPECMDHSPMCPFWKQGGLCDKEGEFGKEMQDLCSATCEWCG